MKFICAICKAAFSKPGDMADYAYNEHIKSKQTVTGCPLCGQKLSTQRQVDDAQLYRQNITQLYEKSLENGGFSNG